MIRYTQNSNEYTEIGGIYSFVNVEICNNVYYHNYVQYILHLIYIDRLYVLTCSAVNIVVYITIQYRYMTTYLNKLVECVNARLCAFIRQNFIHEFLDREQYEGIFSKEFGGRENGRLFVC